jgi:hypothetical protein
VSKPEGGHDYRNSIRVLQSHGRFASPSKIIMRVPTLSCKRDRFATKLSQWTNAHGERRAALAKLRFGSIDGIS